MWRKRCQEKEMSREWNVWAYWAYCVGTRDLPASHGTLFVWQLARLLQAESFQQSCRNARYWKLPLPAVVRALLVARRYKCKRHVMTKCFNFRQYASCILFARRWPDGGKDTGSCPVLVWRMASTCGGASLWTISSGCWKLVKWKNQTICSMSLASSCRALARCSCA